MLHSLSPHTVQWFSVGKVFIAVEPLGFPKVSFDHIRNGILCLSLLEVFGAK